MAAGAKKRSGVVIRGVRSAIICTEAVEADHGALTIREVHGHRILASHRPGLEKLHLYLEVECDGEASVYGLRVVADGLDMKVRTAIPDGWKLASATYPIMIPFLQAGPFTVTVSDAARPNKVWTIGWELDFSGDAIELEDQAASKKEARELAGRWAKSMEEAGNARTFN